MESKRGYDASLGAIGFWLAVFLSWSANHSIWWAILHGLFSWTYVCYHFVILKGLFS